jgi:flagellar hook-associated protein 1 FlgK
MAAGGLTAIGLSGATAYQSALTVIGNNLANMSDPNYTRRIPQFSERAYGSGVSHDSTDRMYSDYLTTDLRSSVSQFHQYDAYYELASGLDSYLGNASSSVGVALNNFFSELQNLNASPSSMVSRQGFINESNSLVSRFQNMQQQLTGQRNDINQEISASVQQVNSLTQQIAALNTDLTGNTQDPTLLDQRDGLLKELSQYLPVSTRANTDGSMDVYFSNGMPLVVAGNASTVSAVKNPQDPSSLTLALSSKFSTTLLGDKFNGGSIGGLFQYQNDVLKPAAMSLNRLSLVTADAMNRQHQSGVNLNNQLGGNFFSDINSPQLMSNRVIANSNNTGSGTFSVMINDSSALYASDYQLTFSSPTDYTLVRNSDGQTLSSGTLSSYPATITADGYSVNISGGSFNAGDRYRISPTATAIDNMSVVVKNPMDIALAAPIRTSSSISNQGSGTIQFQGVTDINNASFSTPGSLSPPLTIEFLSETSYQIVNADTSAVIEGPIAYVPNTEQMIFPTPGSYEPGYRIQISGSPKQGDNFSIGFNNNSQGDNQNGLQIQALQIKKIIQNGNSSLSESYGTLSGQVASKTNHAKAAAVSSETVMQQAEGRRSNYSGVNQQEELATMMFYLKAFEANAKMISVADSMFSSMIDLM